MGSTQGQSGEALMDFLESDEPIELDEDLYRAMKITDEMLDIDISWFGKQVLDAQARAVSEAIWNKYRGKDN